MSSDNGIYILEMKDQCRVIHAQAIDNLWWSEIENNEVADMVPTRILEYYLGEIPMTLEDAGQEASRLYNEIINDGLPIEYGICHFAINKTWDEIVKEAKELIPQEIAAIKSFSNYERNSEYFDELIERLESYLEL